MMVVSASDFTATFIPCVPHEGITQIAAVVLILGHHEAQVPMAAVVQGYERIVIKFIFNCSGYVFQAFVAIIKEGNFITMVCKADDAISAVEEGCVRVEIKIYGTEARSLW